MKTNIFLLGLSSSHTKMVAYALSLHLEMFYADVNDLLKFDLTDIGSVIDKCGVEYVEKLETKQVRNVANFQNTVYTMTFATFYANIGEPSIKERSIVVFLDLPKQYCKSNTNEALHQIDDLLYKDRRAICREYADIQVKCTSLSEQKIVKAICEKLEKAYTGGER